jgi:hypothetical protein
VCITSSVQRVFALEGIGNNTGVLYRNLKPDEDFLVESVHYERRSSHHAQLIDRRKVCSDRATNSTPAVLIGLVG